MAEVYEAVRVMGMGRAGYRDAEGSLDEEVSAGVEARFNARMHAIEAESVRLRSTVFNEGTEAARDELRETKVKLRESLQENLKLKEYALELRAKLQTEFKEYRVQIQKELQDRSAGIKMGAEKDAWERLDRRVKQSIDDYETMRSTHETEREYFDRILELQEDVIAGARDRVRNAEVSEDMVRMQAAESLRQKKNLKELQERVRSLEGEVTEGKLRVTQLKREKEQLSQGGDDARLLREARGRLATAEELIAKLQKRLEAKDKLLVSVARQGLRESVDASTDCGGLPSTEGKSAHERLTDQLSALYEQVGLVDEREQAEWDESVRSAENSQKQQGASASSASRGGGLAEYREQELLRLNDHLYAHVQAWDGRNVLALVKGPQSDEDIGIKGNVEEPEWFKDMTGRGTFYAIGRDLRPVQVNAGEYNFCLAFGIGVDGTPVLLRTEGQFVKSEGTAPIDLARVPVGEVGEDGFVSWTEPSAGDAQSSSLGTGGDMVSMGAPHEEGMGVGLSRGEDSGIGSSHAGQHGVGSAREGQKATGAGALHVQGRGGGIRRAQHVTELIGGPVPPGFSASASVALGNVSGGSDARMDMAIAAADAAIRLHIQGGANVPEHIYNASMHAALQALSFTESPHSRSPDYGGLSLEGHHIDGRRGTSSKASGGVHTVPGSAGSSLYSLEAFSAQEAKHAQKYERFASAGGRSRPRMAAGAAAPPPTHSGHQAQVYKAAPQSRMHAGAPPPPPAHTGYQEQVYKVAPQGRMQERGAPPPPAQGTQETVVHQAQVYKVAPETRVQARGGAPPPAQGTQETVVHQTVVHKQGFMPLSEPTRAEQHGSSKVSRAKRQMSIVSHLRRSQVAEDDKFSHASMQYPNMLVESGTSSVGIKTATGIIYEPLQAEPSYSSGLPSGASTPPGYLPESMAASPVPPSGTSRAAVQRKPRDKRKEKSWFDHRWAG